MDSFSNSFTCSECFQKCNIFKALTNEQLDEIYQHRYDTSFRKGEIIAKQGSPISNIVSLSDGLAKLVLETPGKPDILLTIVKPTTIITSPGMFLDNRYHFSVVSLTETKACFINMNIIRKLFADNDEFARRFHRSIGERSVMLFDRFRNIIHKNMAGRIADSILFLYHEIYDENLEFNLDLNRTELAEYSYMTKESVSRILKEFKDEGIVDVNHEKIRILNLERLEFIAKNG